MTTRRATPRYMLKEFGARLARTRLAMGIATKTDLANLIGVNEDTVGNWEKGRNYPKNDELQKLCDVMGVTSDWVLFGRANGLTVEAYRKLTGP